MTDRLESVPMAELLRPAEVARLLNVSQGTVRRWITEGHLTAIKTPGGQHRIDADSVARLMAMPTPNPEQPAAA
jgi:excisionase family DNA binding protein